MQSEQPNETALREVWQRELDALAAIEDRVQAGKPLEGLVEAFLELRNKAAQIERYRLDTAEDLDSSRQQAALQRVLAAIERAKIKHQMAREDVMQKLRESNELRKGLASYRQR